MSLAAPVRSRRPVRRGWRPTVPGERPTLGQLVIGWVEDNLPSPDDESKPLRYTNEQARRILRWYELDPDTGERVYRRMHLEEAKGWGKSPFAATLDLAEFAGPVCFDGWDAKGQPVGVPWGTGERPPPWIQIAAVSEDQTENTYGALYSLLTANEHRAAKDLRIDEGRTRLYLRDMPGARLEPVTASAGSREGQRLTKATLDEPQLWTPSNGGLKLARTLLRNLAKMDGTGVFTGNAPVVGERSVAELFNVPEPGVLLFANRPSEEPQPDWPDKRMLAELDRVYGDAHWINRRRLLKDIADPAHSWDEKLRYFFNWRTDAIGQRWMPADLWSDRKGEVVFDSDQPLYIHVAFSPDNRAASIASAQRDGESVLLAVDTFPDADDADDFVEVVGLEEHLRNLAERYPTEVMMAHRPKPGATEQLVSVAGPEISYHGAFFEGSAQRLRDANMALVYTPHTAQLLQLAADRLMGLAVEEKLTHDGGADRQIGNVIELPSSRLARLGVADGRRAPAAFAAMVAVQRLMHAPKAAELEPWFAHA